MHTSAKHLDWDLGRPAKDVCWVITEGGMVSKALCTMKRYYQGVMVSAEVVLEQNTDLRGGRGIVVYELFTTKDVAVREAQDRLKKKLVDAKHEVWGAEVEQQKVEKALAELSVEEGK